jgi:hypothetical protein
MRRLSAPRRLAILAVLSATLLACPRPPPPPADGGTPVVTPSSWISTARVVIQGVHWVLPAIDGIVSLFPDSTIPAQVKAIVHQSITLVTSPDGTLHAFEEACNIYETRGGDACPAYAAAGLLTRSLMGIASTLAQAGFSIGIDVENLVADLGAIADLLIPACQHDAGFASVGASYRTELDGLRAVAQAHGNHGALDLSSWAASHPRP